MEAKNTVNLGMARSIGIGLSILGGIGIAAGMSIQSAMFHSYLFAWVMVMALTLGCFGVTLLYHTTRGSWGTAVVRLYEAGGGPWMFVWMFIAWIPIALNLGKIYHWAHPGELAKLAVEKQYYLNETWFLVRTVLYFFVWFGLAWILRTSSLADDKNPDPKRAIFRTNLSAPGLVVFVVSVTFAITDWVMSIDPHWGSTIYGFWYVTSGALAALSLGTIVVCWNRAKKPYSEIISPQLTKDLGNLCFAFTMFWCYVTVSQFIITWSGNLPEYTRYYVDRRISQVGEFWNVLGAINVVFGFFVPWTLLLAPRTKSNPRILLGVAVLIFLMRIVDMYWNVIPGMRQTGFDPRDLAALALLGGLWLIVFGSVIRTGPVIPTYDTRLLEAEPHHA